MNTLTVPAVDEINAKIAELAETFAENHRSNGKLDPQDWAWKQQPMETLPLEVGMKVKFLGDRRWWTVEAVNHACAVLTRAAAFDAKGRYTIISWEQTRRGPQTSWGLGAQTPEQCREMAAAFADGKTTLSQRSALYLDIEAVRA